VNIDKLVAAIMLASLTFGAGLQVDRAHLVDLFKQIGLLERALLANCVIVPALGVGIAKLFHLPTDVAIGFLLMAIAPGVPFVLASVRKRGGRLSLAVALAIMLPLISIVTVPLTAAFVLPAGASAHIPLARFLLTLILFQFVPLMLGILVGARNTNLAERLTRPSQIVFFAAAIVLIAMLAQKIGESAALVYGSNGLWAILSLVILSLGVGWILGGPAREDRRILAIGTALRNIGLGAVIATVDFRAPQVAATVIMYFVIQFAATTILGVYYTKTARSAAA
jgi:BASS family bile acid:Na+ symporter